MKNKGNIIYIIIVLTVLVSIIVGISFAYIIGTQSSAGSLDVNVAIENGVIANFTVTGNTAVTMPISGNAMLEGSAGSVAGTNTTSLTVNLESDIATICSYDIVWEWNNSSDSYVLTSSTNSEPEFTVSGEVQGSNLELEETQVSNYSSSKTLGTFSIAANGSKSTQNWTFTTNFYNINAIQDAHENKTYKGIIKIANADCRKQVSQFISGPELNLKMKMMANESVPNDVTNTNKVVDNIIKGFHRTETLNSSANYSVVSTPESENPIYMWFDSTTNNIYWYSNTHDVYLNENSIHIFNNLQAITDIDTKNLLTGRTKIFSSFFLNDIALVNAGVSGFDTTNATTFASMFYNNQARTTLDVSNFKTSNVSSMASMFFNVRNVNNIDVSHFDTSNVTSMASMFFNARSLTSIDVSNFNTAKVKNFNNMFSYLYLVKNDGIDISNFNTNVANNIGYMFRGMTNITSLNLSNFNTKAVTNMQGMFHSMTALKTLNISSFNTYKVLDMGSMFFNTRALTSIDFSKFNTNKVANMSAMFSGTRNLTTINLSTFNTANVKNMTNMFLNSTKLKTIIVSDKFVTSAIVPFTNTKTGVVTSNEDNMFYLSKNLVGGNGTKYNASNVNKTYAVIDTAETPGYFTAVEVLSS